MADASSPPGQPATLAQELGFIGFAIAFLAVMIVVFIPVNPDDIGSEDMNAGDFIIGITYGAAYAIWISIDLKRSGRKVGGWRFLAFFLAVPTTMFYLASAYKLRGLYLIPAYFFVVIVPVIL